MITFKNAARLAAVAVFFGPVQASGLLASSLAVADTYYVRADGGDARACTGRADRPYEGRTGKQDCAWRHPFLALPPDGEARISGGDTVYIGPGSYMMGLGAPGAENCHQDWSWECHLGLIPSGPSPEQPTRILGAGYQDGCKAAPELWGTERSWMVINMEGSSNVELACLEITDRGNCIESHCHNGRCPGKVAACERDQPPWGSWAPTGISARDSSNVRLRDIKIHGMANRGIYAGRLRDWTLERVVLRANGWAGWDGNIGSDSANSGKLIFRDVEIAWNGCGETWSEGEIFGCWADGGGGYGDGLGTGETGGHWIFEDSAVHHNTSDGIDLLYLNDHGRVTITRTLVHGNAGNQIKASRSAHITDSTVIGNCGVFAGHDNMLDDDHCRAAGDAIYVGLKNGSQTDLINNTISGHGNCLISSGEGDRNSRLRLINNVMLGSTSLLEAGKKSCLYYSGSRREDVVWTNNVIAGVRNAACPRGNLCLSMRHE